MKENEISNKMNSEIINAISRYIDILVNTNKKLIKVCGSDAIDDINDSGVDNLDVIQSIPRLIPYSFDFNSQKLILDNKNGLMEFKDVLSYLENDYNDILNTHYEELDKVRLIRNKLEHKVHIVRLISAYSGNDSWFKYCFEINEKEYFIESTEMIELLKRINILFDKLIKDMLHYSFINKQDSHPFFQRISRINLIGYNKMYESNVLYEIGKLLKD